MMHGLVWWCIGNEAAAGKHHDAIDHRDQGMDDVLWVPGANREA